MNWTIEHMDSQKGKVALVTGANSGLGFYTAKGLAAKGAEVIMACRSLDKGEAALNKIKTEMPEASLVLKRLDLADLKSVHQFAEEVKAAYNRLDLLINNAGLMAIPYRKTADGFEMQFGVNHLGHFALTGLLIDLVKKTPGSRIVNVSSNAHYMGEIRFEDLHWEKRYNRWRAYGMSKLANLMFTMELQERLQKNGNNVMVLAAHPGYADSNLIEKGPEMAGARMMVRLGRVANSIFAQSTEMGALPTLYAATNPDVEPGGYYGPKGWKEMKGYPKRVYPGKKKMDPEAQKKLWDVSEHLTNVAFTL
jgi:NAD(P)-dependent dehydrogenase (short-subunit alcohol dehydrogenase family)